MSIHPASVPRPADGSYPAIRFLSANPTAVRLVAPRASRCRHIQSVRHANRSSLLIINLDRLQARSARDPPQRRGVRRLPRLTGAMCKFGSRNGDVVDPIGASLGHPKIDRIKHSKPRRFCERVVPLRQIDRQFGLILVPPSSFSHRTTFVDPQRRGKASGAIVNVWP